MNEQLASYIGEVVLSNWLSMISLFFSFCSGLVVLTWFVSNLIHKREISLLEIQLAHQKEQFVQFESIVNQRVDALKEQAGLVQDVIKQETNNSSEVYRNEIMYSKEQKEPEAQESSLLKFLTSTEALNGLITSIMRIM
ncbi:hypothetical protein [Vibrio splendidus]|uniref:hypothetical protein n=1 Tax=Vibrio splendidus TaxID=29497 RepID=UPI000D3D9AC2|nr:hypothetical protein [Vibrio splendidus]PTO74858.1 hypothetical protein CWN84_16150 [Vibrio splendidus]